MYKVKPRYKYRGFLIRKNDVPVVHKSRMNDVLVVKLANKIFLSTNYSVTILRTIGGWRGHQPSVFFGWRGRQPSVFLGWRGRQPTGITTSSSFTNPGWTMSSSFNRTIISTKKKKTKWMRIILLVPIANLYVSTLFFQKKPHKKGTTDKGSNYSYR